MTRQLAFQPLPASVLFGTLPGLIDDDVRSDASIESKRYAESNKPANQASWSSQDGYVE